MAQKVINNMMKTPNGSKKNSIFAFHSKFQIIMLKKIYTDIPQQYLVCHIADYPQSAICMHFIANESLRRPTPFCYSPIPTNPNVSITAVKVPLSMPWLHKLPEEVLN